MASQYTDRQTHWQKVYQGKTPDSASWYRPHLDVSLELLALPGLSPGSRIIDIGGGASTLVDDLLASGLKDITVLDISSEALAVARARLRDRARDVTWLVGDVLQVKLPAGDFDFWHDRAVFHFLTDPAEAAVYARQVAGAVKTGGYAVMGGFAPDGPERCSGLSVARRSGEEIAGIFGPAFSLQATRHELHVTPAGSVQSFQYALLKRH